MPRLSGIQTDSSIYARTNQDIGLTVNEQNDPVASPLSHPQQPSPFFTALQPTTEFIDGGRLFMLLAPFTIFVEGAVLQGAQLMHIERRGDVPYGNIIRYPHSFLMFMCANSGGKFVGHNGSCEI